MINLFVNVPFVTRQIKITISLKIKIIKLFEMEPEVVVVFQVSTINPGWLSYTENC
jgi:hypothetical protein